MNSEDLAKEIYCIYNSLRSGAAKEIHADVWQYLNPYEKQVWEDTAKELKILLTPAKARKAAPTTEE
ncbi:hypothetical protein ACX27_26680 [Nostoc piscinale CENA21]|uniref:Uncharacterized protein n=1 Tax=Nostoc piscinale CENA21 TaxID=224013 RepID=A0A0M4SVA1_9NOSO|nr:hypothetical protein [Nostoc piscinale]ALF55615.1 hypothetical protein ACX27_26680 [Nostoc piscinale CENA21]